MMFFDHPYTKKIQELSSLYEDRYRFHKEAESTIRKMATDPEFLDGVVQYNLNRVDFLMHEWSLYEIPCLWIADTGDFQMKFHIFLPMKDFQPGVAASAIHHHNNYLLSTLGVCGSGYETFIFEKGTQLDPDKGPIDLRVSKNFIQGGGTYTLVDSWEPHVVFNPEMMSATLTLWTTDKKRTTDKLRHNPLLKAVKKPLRYMIHAFGMDEHIGIASAETYQFYVHENKFKAVREEDFFAPSKAAKGEEVNDQYIRTIFAFLQVMKYRNKEFLKDLSAKPTTPESWKKWIFSFVKDEEINPAETVAEINVPDKLLRKEDILQAQVAIPA